MRRCILTFLFFLFYGLGEDRRLGIIVWVEALGGRSCTICYNVLLFCSFSFSFFFFFIYRLYYHSIITNWYNIHKNPKSRSTLLHCITIASALSSFPLRLSHGFWSRRVEKCPQNVTHHNLRGSRSLVPGSLQTDLSGRLSGSNVEQIGPLAAIEHGRTVLSTRPSSELSTSHSWTGFFPSPRFRMAMSSSLHRGYGHPLPTIRILLYSCILYVEHISQNTHCNTTEYCKSQ